MCSTSMLSYLNFKLPNKIYIKILILATPNLGLTKDGVILYPHPEDPRMKDFEDQCHVEIADFYIK